MALTRCMVLYQFWVGGSHNIANVYKNHFAVHYQDLGNANPVAVQSL